MGFFFFFDGQQVFDTSFKPKLDGARRKKLIRGNTISAEIAQLNTKIVKAGSKSLEDLLGTKKEEPAEGEAKSEDAAVEKPAKAAPAEEPKKEEAPSEEPKSEEKSE